MIKLPDGTGIKIRQAQIIVKILNITGVAYMIFVACKIPYVVLTGGNGSIQYISDPKGKAENYYQYYKPLGA